MGSYKSLSTRSLETDLPVMVKLEKLKESAKDAMPLGQDSWLKFDGWRIFCAIFLAVVVHMGKILLYATLLYVRTLVQLWSHATLAHYHMMRQKQDLGLLVMLKKGAVYWKPPEEAVAMVNEIAWETCISRYGSHEGLPQLREALLNKLQKENKLLKSDVMVTAGSNQGFLNLVLSLCDTFDSVILFAPYFFNAYMTFKMTGINDILVGPSDQTTLLPDADWLEKTLSEVKPVPKLVSIVNPGNPSGVILPDPLLKRISDICGRAGTWLVVDNAYEYFTYDGFEHSCVEADHVINLFTFSKAYGIMGWRVGYIVYSPEVEGLKEQLLKAQDNVAICTPMISQHLAYYCLQHGREWVKNQVKSLARNKKLLLDAFSPLGKDAVKGGQGAIYLWVKLPDKFSDDFEVVTWFARKHGVLLLPGSACGVKGCVRVTYGMVKDMECELAAKRLRIGVEELVRDGLVG